MFSLILQIHGSTPDDEELANSLKVSKEVASPCTIAEDTHAQNETDMFPPTNSNMASAVGHDLSVPPIDASTLENPSHERDKTPGRQLTEEGDKMTLQD